MARQKQPKEWQSAQQDRLLRLVSKFPGLDAIALKGKGYHPASHGSLVVAERGGWLTYRNGGWYLSEVSQLEVF